MPDQAVIRYNIYVGKEVMFYMPAYFCLKDSLNAQNLKNTLDQ